MTKKMRLVVFVLLMGTVLVKWACAVEVKPGGLIFAHYELATSQHLQNGTTAHGYNSFEVSRIYLNADAKYDEKISAFIQLEANLTSRDNKNNRVYLKNAELRMKFHEAAKISAGIVSAPWRGYEEGIWKNRFAAKVLEDFEGLLFSSDRGIKLSGKAPFIAYDAMISNGEGTGADGTSGNENTAVGAGGRLKDFALKIAVSPLESQGENLKGLKINLLAHRGDKNESQKRDRFYGGLSYESKYLNLMGTYFNANNGPIGGNPSRGEGFSFHFVVTPIEKSWFFVRFDKYDPDIHVGEDAHNRYIGGIGYQMIKGVRVSADYQYLQQEKRKPGQQDEGMFFVHTEAKF